MFFPAVDGPLEPPPIIPQPDSNRTVSRLAETQNMSRDTRITTSLFFGRALDQTLEAQIIAQNIEIRCVAKQFWRNAQIYGFLQGVQAAIGIAELLIDDARIEQQVRAFRLEAQASFESSERGFSISPHGIVFRKVAEKLCIVRIEAKIFLAEGDGLSVRGRGFGASARSPVIGISEVSPHHVIFIIKLDGLFKILCGLRVLAHLKMSRTEIGKRVGCCANVQRLLQNRNGFTVFTLQNTDGPKVVIAGEAVRG